MSVDALVPQFCMNLSPLWRMGIVGEHEGELPAGSLLSSCTAGRVSGLALE